MWLSQLKCLLSKPDNLSLTPGMKVKVEIGNSVDYPLTSTLLPHLPGPNTNKELKNNKPGTKVLD